MKHQVRDNFEGVITNEVHGLQQQARNPDKFYPIYGCLAYGIIGPSHGISLFSAATVFMNAGLGENHELFDKLKILAEEFDQYLRSKGYRDFIHTEQELELLRGGDTRKKSDRPYMPQCLADGKYSLEEVRKARELELFYGAFGFYFGFDNHGVIEDSFTKITLEPLGADGNTLRDPKPVGKDLKLISDYKKSSDFPYARD